MNDVVQIQNHLNKIEKELTTRIQSVEGVLVQLLEEVRGLKDTDVFMQMVHSDAFQTHKEETRALLEKEPQTFVDPFEVYRTTQADE